MKKPDKKIDKKPIYILCPRCELNYINKKDKLCKICKAELGMGDPSILLPDEEEIGLERLCPQCKVNYLADDETICIVCLKDSDIKDDEADTTVLGEEAENWQQFIDDVPEDEVTPEELEIELEMEGVVAEDESEEEEEEFYHDEEPDDFDYDVDPNDFIDDEDDEDDEDDDFLI